MASAKSFLNPILKEIAPANGGRNFKSA